MINPVLKGQIIICDGSVIQQYCARRMSWQAGWYQSGTRSAELSPEKFTGVTPDSVILVSEKWVSVLGITGKVWVSNRSGFGASP